MEKRKHRTPEQIIQDLQNQILEVKVKADLKDQPELKFALDCVKKIEKGIQENAFTEEEVKEVQSFLNMIRDRVLNQ